MVLDADFALNCESVFFFFAFGPRDDPYVHMYE